MEDLALAELADLLEQIKHLDPHTYGDLGDHETHFGPQLSTGDCTDDRRASSTAPSAWTGLIG